MSSGEQLGAWRRGAGISEPQLAAKLNISVDLMRRIEAGEVEPVDPLAAQLAELSQDAVGAEAWAMPIGAAPGDNDAPSALIVNSADGPRVRVRLGGGQSDLAPADAQTLYGQLGPLLQLLQTGEIS